MASTGRGVLEVLGRAVGPVLGGRQAGLEGTCSFIQQTFDKGFVEGQGHRKRSQGLPRSAHQVPHS